MTINKNNKDLESLPFREKISPDSWARKVYNNCGWAVEFARASYRQRWGKYTSKNKPLSSKR